VIPGSTESAAAFIGPRAEQYQIIKDAYRAEGVPLENARITVNRFAHITDSREEGLRFAENARYQSRLLPSPTSWPAASRKQPPQRTARLKPIRVSAHPTGCALRPSQISTASTRLK
jgi:hypothetical protein